VLCCVVLCCVVLCCVVLCCVVMCCVVMCCVVLCCVVCYVCALSVPRVDSINNFSNICFVLEPVVQVTVPMDLNLKTDRIDDVKKLRSTPMIVFLESCLTYMFEIQVSKLAGIVWWDEWNQACREKVFRGMVSPV